jgi:biotin synthase
VRLSAAAAITLGFKRGLFYRNAKLTCINLLMTYEGGCRANCLYCGQAREATGMSGCKSLIRVSWPACPLEEVVKRLPRVRNYVQRLCVATITHPKAREDILPIIRRVHEGSDLPISALITPTLFRKEDVEALKSAGVEMIGVAVDAATPKLFDKLRGRGAGGPHRWERYIRGIHEAVEVFGEGKVGCHLIIGLGESEREAIEFVQLVRDIGANTHLFSFFPEAESALKDMPPPPIEQYRRIQLARYLIDEELSRFELMKFNSIGQATDFGLDGETLSKVIESGKPFQTSGCPGCNRPYANERPSQPMRNFPFPPSEEDIRVIMQQLKLNAYQKAATPSAFSLFK